VLYDLRHSDRRVRWLVTLLLGHAGDVLCVRRVDGRSLRGVQHEQGRPDVSAAGEAVMGMQMRPRRRW